MSKYSTEKTYDGRKARCGDIVVIACAKYLRDLRAGVVDIAPEGWTFVATRTEADIEKLEIGQWTWPLDLVMRHAEGGQVPVPPSSSFEVTYSPLTMPRQKCQNTGPSRIPCSQDAVPGQLFCAAHTR